MQALWLAETYLERMEEAVARRDRAAAANLRDTLAGILWELGRVPYLEDRVQPLQRRYAELCLRVDELYGNAMPPFLVRAQERCGATRSPDSPAVGTGIPSQSTAMAPQCQPMAEQQMAIRRDGEGAAAGVTEHCSEGAPHVRGLADRSGGIAAPAAWSGEAQRYSGSTAQQHGREERGQSVAWSDPASACAEAARESDAQRWHCSEGLGSALRRQHKAETWRESQASHRELAHGNSAVGASTGVPGAAPGLRRPSTRPSDGKAGVGVTVHVPSPPLTTVLRRLVQQQRERMVLSVTGVSNGTQYRR